MTVLVIQLKPWREVHARIVIGGLVMAIGLLGAAVF
jgi:hypothetical protein